VLQKQNKSPSAAKMAHVIVQDSKLYQLAQEQLGFKAGTYRTDALRFQTAKLFHSLDSPQKNAFSVVRQYVALNHRIAKQAHHINQLKTSYQSA